MISYHFTQNKLYNSTNIRRVRWWNELIGHPGEMILARVNLLDVNEHNQQSIQMAKKEFESIGLHRQCMGDRW